MPHQRKLFIAHASELAHRYVRAIRTGGIIASFVRSYAERYNRVGLYSNPERNRELDSTIGREALLVIAAKVGRILPAAFSRETAASKNRPGHRANSAPYLGPAEAALAQAFYAEFLASLGRSLEWSPSEAVAEATAFGRDLEMYQRWSGRSESQMATQLNPQFDMSFAQRINQRFSANPNSNWEAMRQDYSAELPPADPIAISGAGKSPFPDRCALILDPSMMDQARKAATEFEAEISRLAARMFAQLGRPSSSPRRKPSRKPSRVSRPATKKRPTPKPARKPRLKTNPRPTSRPSKQKPQPIRARKKTIKRSAKKSRSRKR